MSVIQLVSQRAKKLGAIITKILEHDDTDDCLFCVMDYNEIIDIKRTRKLSVRYVQ